ncbi:alpha/beta hydrolase [Aspergillus foveolatus]|uniref:alpha/beta hydrolase n=1 Tax=Aspergillus foveolatus TaxID=210207 RepID=UPI003CCCAC30
MAKGEPLTSRSQFLDEFGESPAIYGSLPELRSSWSEILQKMVAKYEIQPNVDETVHARNVTLDHFWLRVYTPPGASTSRPAGIYFHGGGWAMGAVDEEDAFCRLVSKHHRMIMVSVEYRLAPKYQYPIPLDDCVEAVKWSLENLQPPSVVLIGASAGGNLAFGAALKLADQHLGGNTQGVVSLVPVTVHPEAVPAALKSRYTSYATNADATVNTDSAMRTYFDAYGAPANDIYTSCLLHPRLGQLKKVYIAECGADTLRDDARLMKDALENAGVPVAYDDYPGYPHYSWTFPSKHLDQHREEFLAKVLEGVKWVAMLDT